MRFLKSMLAKKYHGVFLLQSIIITSFAVVYRTKDHNPKHIPTVTASDHSILQRSPIVKRKRAV